MPFDGNGNYVPISPPDFPAVPGTTIRASQYNNEINDIASALTDCVTRDGQSPATSDLPMGNNKHTGVGIATAKDQYARVQEVQSGLYTTLTSISVAGTTSTTITATAPMQMSVYSTGMSFRFVMPSSNVGNVKININAIGDKSLLANGSELGNGVLSAGRVVDIFYDGTNFQLLTSGFGSSGGSFSSSISINGLINGAATIAQRMRKRTTPTGALTTNLSYQTVDRWCASGGTGSYIVQSTSVPDGFRNSIKIGRSSTSDVTKIVVAQVLETKDSIRFSGQQVNFSFYAKKGTDYTGGSIRIRILTGTSVDQGANAFFLGGTTALDALQTITTTYTRYDFTATLPSNIQQVGVEISWIPIGTATTDDNIYLTGLQLVIGGLTAFEFREDIYEESLCRRFYQGISINTIPKLPFSYITQEISPFYDMNTIIPCYIQPMRLAAPLLGLFTSMTSSLANNSQIYIVGSGLFNCSITGYIYGTSLCLRARSSTIPNSFIEGAGYIKPNIAPTPEYDCDDIYCDQELV